MNGARIDIEQIKEEWLVGNSVVAFVGALLMAQAWEPSDAKSVIPIINVTVPAFPQAVVLGIVAFLATLSFVLASASAIPPLRNWAIHQVSPYSQVLDLLMWAAFTLSLIAALGVIPPDQWWAQALWFAGAALLFFLWARMVLRPLVVPTKLFIQLLFRLVSKAGNLMAAARRSRDDEPNGSSQ